MHKYCTNPSRLRTVFGVSLGMEKTKHIKITCPMPWSVWLCSSERHPVTGRSWTGSGSGHMARLQVLSQVQAQVPIIPSLGICRRQPVDASLSHKCSSLSFSLSLKAVKKMPLGEDTNDNNNKITCPRLQAREWASRTQGPASPWARGVCPSRSKRHWPRLSMPHYILNLNWC